MRENQCHNPEMEFMNLGMPLIWNAPLHPDDPNDWHFLAHLIRGLSELSWGDK